MTDTIRVIVGGILAGLVVLLGSWMFGGSLPAVGGVYSEVKKDFSEGISIDETTVIDGDRNLTAVDATISDDLNVAGDTVVEEFTQGGGVLSFTATSTQAARTLTEAELLANNVIEIVSTNAPALALSLPATSSMTTLLPNAGDFREWIIDNQHLAATTTTITAGTGIDLIAYTTNDDVIDGLEVSRLTCWRKANTDVYCLTSEYLKAD